MAMDTQAVTAIQVVMDIQADTDTLADMVCALSFFLSTMESNYSEYF